MCGIAGIFTRNAAPIEASISRMAGLMEHRGPNGQGVWLDVEAGIALGHRRLAVLDLSDAGKQPMVSRSGRWVVVLNGEIYNHLEVRRDIESGTSHDTWNGHSDTETIAASFDTWGFRDALPRLNGMFAIAAWDRAERSLWLARDRMGEKPLYYGWVNGSFVFASELRPIRAFSGGAGLSVSLEALALLTSLNYIPAPRTIYREINKLLPGTCIKLLSPDRTTLSNDGYWSFPAQCDDEHVRGGLDAHVNLVDAVLRQAVRRQMLADVPLGALLSGGIDSSLVVAMMQAQSATRVKTFTIGFEERLADESLHAKAVADYLGTDHHEMVVTASAACDQIPRLPSLLDEPMGDSSQIPTMCVMGLARQHVTVALSGDGADELFGGYGRYRSIPRFWAARRWIPQAAIRILANGLEQSAWDHLALRVGARGKASLLALRYYLPRIAAAKSARALYASTLTQWVGADLVRGSDQDAAEYVHEVLDGRSSKNLASFMMETDAMTYLPDDVLVKVDRAAMAHSLETRAPFLDKDVIELSSRITLSSKLDKHRGKVVLRECLARYLPRPLFERPKQGFSVPLDAWLRGPLRPWAEELLDPARIEGDGYLNAEPIRHVWARHQASQLNAGHQLWSVLMFQAWLENVRKVDSSVPTFQASRVIA